MAMSEGFLPGDPFAEMDGKDGFHIIQMEKGDVLTLALSIYSNGQLSNPFSADPDQSYIELCRIEQPSTVHLGAADRLYDILAALCRYLTIGGTWEELTPALALIRQTVQDGLKFPGYHIVSTYRTSEGPYQHVFSKDDGSGDAALWEESEEGDNGFPVGGWINSTTLEKIQEQKDNGKKEGEEDEEYEEDEEAEPAEGSTQSTPDVLSLPPGPSLPDPGGPQDNSGLRGGGENADPG